MVVKCFPCPPVVRTGEVEFHTSHTIELITLKIKIFPACNKLFIGHEEAYVGSAEYLTLEDGNTVIISRDCILDPGLHIHQTNSQIVSNDPA